MRRVVTRLRESLLLEQSGTSGMVRLWTNVNKIVKNLDNLAIKVSLVSLRYFISQRSCSSWLFSIANLQKNQSACKVADPLLRMKAIRTTASPVNTPIGVESSLTKQGRTCYIKRMCVLCEIAQV